MSQFLVGLDLGQVSDFSALSVLRKSTVTETGEEWAEPEKIRVGDRGSTLVTKTPKLMSCYEAQHLQRFELRTSYPEVVERTCGLFCRPQLAGQTLVVDGTGVGRPVVDMLRRAKSDPVRCPKCSGSGRVSEVVTGPIPGLGSGFFEASATAAPCQTCGGHGKIKLNARLIAIAITAGAGWSINKETGWFHVSKKELVSVLQVLLQSDPGRLRIGSTLKWAQTLVKELSAFRVKITAGLNETFECLIAGTMIETSQGLRPIETIQAGDHVLTRIGFCRVLRAGETKRVNEIMSVQIGGMKLSGTKDHLVWTEDRGWVELEDLVLWDRCQHRRVLTIPVVEHHQEPQPVYDIVVEDYHEFYANGILVHNSWRDKDHDDLVLSVAVAVWFGEVANRKFWIR